MKRRRYGMVNRPAGLGTLPCGLFYRVEPRPAPGEPHHEVARHGILVPDRELAASEMLSFEIAGLVEEDDLASHAQHVVDRRMIEYVSECLESAAEDMELFTRGVLDVACRGDDGVVYSIGNPERLVREVIDRLKMLSRAPQVTAAGCEGALCTVARTD